MERILSFSYLSKQFHKNVTKILTLIFFKNSNFTIKHLKYIFVSSLNQKFQEFGKFNKRRKCFESLDNGKEMKIFTDMILTNSGICVRKKS